MRLTLLVVVVLAVILVPFALWGDRIDAWAAAFIAAAHEHPVWSAVVLGSLLAGDILLPVPSSIVSTACGAVLGMWLGTLVSLAGMTVSCVAGFALGRWSEGFAERALTERERARLHRLTGRLGVWLVAALRPVPVLAEASALFAGMAGMRFPAFFAVATVANLAVSLVYAVAGSLAMGNGTFLFAFVAAMVIPGLLMGIANRR